MSYAIAGGAAAGGMIGPIVSSAMQANQSEKLQKRAQDFALKMALHQYGIQKRSLVRAGYNPMLAMGAQPNIPSVGGVPGTPMPQIETDPAKAISSAKEAATLKDAIKQKKDEAITAEHNRRTARNVVDKSHEEALQAIDQTLIKAEELGTAKAVREQEQLKLNEARRTSEAYEGQKGRILKGVEKGVKAISPLK